jgi:phage gp36-like protein
MCETYATSKKTLTAYVLQHTCITIATYVTSRSIFATSIQNTCNIHLKQLKHSFASSGGEILGLVDSDRQGESQWQAVAREHHQHWARSWVPLARSGTT